MQPSEPLSPDIKTLHDWIYGQFKPTDPVEVQNILDKQYYFKYCVSEDVATPDPVTRQVRGREYDEKTVPAGESIVLMGAAAYIFIAGVAHQYVFETEGAEATGNLQKLVEAAQLCIIGVVGYAKKAEPKAPHTAHNNPTAIKDDNGVTPSQVPPTGSDEDDDAFGDMGNPLATEFEHDGNFYDVAENGRYRKNKKFTSEPEYLAAQEAHHAATAA